VEERLMRVKRLVVRLSVIVLIAASGFFAFWAMGTSWFWGFQIAAYEKQDRINPPKSGVIVFTGSSSIRFWHTLSEDMKPLGAINRGFGGSQLSQVNEYASRIVLPYHPTAVVLYAGENDMSWPWHKSADTVLADFQQFVKIVHTAIPDTPIYYVSMKPDPARWSNWPTLANANRMIEAYCHTENHVKFIDVSAAMLDPQGKPRHELFRWDGLHMNSQGYELWTSIIKPVLLDESRQKPIVAVVHRIKSNLNIEIHLNPLPGKDSLRVFNALQDELGSNHPVVAIVDDHARISDLCEVAGKVGFDNVRTFISHYDNGKMFEVKFGPFQN
jgi:lysophospholipase L1-like esterase